MNFQETSDYAKKLKRARQVKLALRVAYVPLIAIGLALLARLIHALYVIVFPCTLHAFYGPDCGGADISTVLTMAATSVALVTIILVSYDDL